MEQAQRNQGFETSGSSVVMNLDVRKRYQSQASDQATEFLAYIFVLSTIMLLLEITAMTQDCAAPEGFTGRLRRSLNTIPFFAPSPKAKESSSSLVLQPWTKFYLFSLKKTSICRRDLTIQILTLIPIFKFHPLLLIETL